MWWLLKSTRSGEMPSRLAMRLFTHSFCDSHFTIDSLNTRNDFGDDCSVDIKMRSNFRKGFS
jgi:hypothetical protein